MIAYFDTSAFIPLIIDEPSSTTCFRLWNEATRVASVRLLYAEARAALAQSHRMARLSRRQFVDAVGQLDVLIDQVDHIEVTEHLVRTAGEVAESHRLRGYDAVHLAAAQSISGDDTVLVSGDQQLIDAAVRSGIAVALTH